jgi:branched-subunit amino acid aminotransferase/4-amino-4-deoxychorismate lyase
VKAWRWNGAALEPCDSLPLTDRGFRYGMAVFESLRVTAGEPEFFEGHLSRLVQACAEREIAIAESAIAASEGLLRAEGASGFARIYVTAGDGGPAAPAEQARLFVFLEPRTPPDPEDAWEIGLHEESHQPLFGGLKTANYWFHCDALAQARKRGLDEMLLFNDRAELISACMANVFLVRNEKLATPPRSSGARAGVIREWVIGRRKVQERRLRREDVVNADEIFLTNSWIGVMPVATVEGRPLGPRSAGPKLAAELERRRE